MMYTCYKHNWGPCGNRCPECAKQDLQRFSSNETNVKLIEMNLKLDEILSILKGKLK